MDSKEIRKKFLTFFEKRGHRIIPSASLVPENDPSVLFTTAGMQPLAPYLLGEAHPLGKRLVDIQKCVRTGDIDAIGDNTHLTFFEMMGNWSLGDYFKKEAIEWSFELLTSEKEGFGLDPKRLYITCFEGDDNAPKDEESYSIWKEVFDKNSISGERIYFLGAESNWWSAGDNGPCGPDTEMFYDLTGEITLGMTEEEFLKADKDQKIVEIWNNVFMEYEKKDGKVIGKLKSKNVDTGSGLERVTAVLQGKNNVFETDLFLPIIEEIRKNSKKESTEAERVVADHLRAATFLIADGVKPDKNERNYVVRRLLRLATTADYLFLSGILNKNFFLPPLEKIFETYGTIYLNLIKNKDEIISIISREINDYQGLLLEMTPEKLTKKYLYFYSKKNISNIVDFNKPLDGDIIFNIRETFGVGWEILKMMLTDMGYKITENTRSEYGESYKRNQEISRSGSEQKFKGGLANTNEQTIKLHTAHHLLLSAIQQVLGKEVKQKGSNITEERLRIDFSYPRKLSPEELKRVEDIVNNYIQADLPVVRREMPLIEAETLGAEMEFGAKYPEIVSIYFIEDKDGNAVSKEFCGGPHVENTRELASIRDPEGNILRDDRGSFKILKEEAVSSGVRRIKATLS